MAVFWSTSRFLWRWTTIQSHDYRSKHHVSFYSVLPDGINDGVREFHVKVKEENNGVFILRKNQGGTGDKILSIASSQSLHFVILTSTRSIPSWRPAARWKFPLSPLYWYLKNWQHLTCWRHASTSVSMQHLTHLLIPRDGGALQRRLHINVSACEVNKDEVVVGVSGYSEKTFPFQRWDDSPIVPGFSLEETEKVERFDWMVFNADKPV